MLASHLPESVPGTTVDRQCGSSQQALHFAAQAVMSGVHDVVIAGGVEVMSLVPIGGNAIAGHKAGMGSPYGLGMKKRYPGAKFNQFAGAEMIAERWGFSREDLDRFGLASHERAASATREGRFARTAFSWLVRPKRSRSSRENPQRSAIISAPANWLNFAPG